MTKRTLIIAAVALICLLAAFFSLFSEKQAVVSELNDLLNGKVPGKENEQVNKEADVPGAGTETKV
ncbi:MAG: hypothetical protein ABSA76_00980 [Bacteroidales bacterium]